MSMIPEGTYNAVAIPNDEGKYCEFGESPKKKTKQVVVQVKITDGEFAGRTRTWIGYLTSDAVDRTIESMRNFGAQGDDISEWPDQQLTVPVQVVVKHEEYEGKPRDRIAFINRVGGGGFKQANVMSKDDLRLFAASLRARVAAKPALPKPNGAPSNDADL